MNKNIKALLRKVLNKVIKRSWMENHLLLMARLGGIDLLNLAFRSNGILKYWDSEVSGENYVVTKLLPRVFSFSNTCTPIILDVGANIGNYSNQLAKLYPNANVYSFEPNPSTFEKLVNNIKPFQNVKSFNQGLGSSKGTLSIYTHGDDLISEHASVFEKVLTDLHAASDVSKRQVDIIALDDFCSEYNIEVIDFLKIDTEGYEYEVLKGAKGLIDQGKIKLIQFEFNEMNVISKVFLRDFYELLKGYSLYRIDSKRLIPLGEYDSKNEIFKFQNILAIYQPFKHLFD